MEASARWNPEGDGRAGLSRSPARIFCLVVGATLVLVGLLGFIAESAFETGSRVQGDDLIIFEVNGWHNVVHIASGLSLLALMGRHDTRADRGPVVRRDLRCRDDRRQLA